MAFMEDPRIVDVIDKDRVPHVTVFVQGPERPPLTVIGMPSPTLYQGFRKDLEYNLREAWSAYHCVGNVTGDEDVLIVSDSELTDENSWKPHNTLRGIGQHVLSQLLTRRVFPEGDFRYRPLTFQEAQKVLRGSTEEAEILRKASDSRPLCTREIIRTYATPDTPQGAAFVAEHWKEIEAERKRLCVEEHRREAQAEAALVLKNPQGAVIPNPTVSLEGVPEKVPTETEMHHMFYDNFNVLTMNEPRGILSGELKIIGEEKPVDLNTTIEGVLKQGGLFHGEIDPRELQSDWNNVLHHRGFFDRRGDAVVEMRWSGLGDRPYVSTHPALERYYALVEPSKTLVVFKKERVAQ